MASADLLILVAVFLPPAALDIFGPVVDERTLHTPYGDLGPIALRAPGQDVAGAGPAVWVQPYTGTSMRTDPRATIYAARKLGIRRILTWDRVVALNPILRRGQLAVVTDYIDWTHHVPTAFTGAAMPLLPERSPVRASPFCMRLTESLYRALPDLLEVVYLGVDGFRRETPAEARMFRGWGADVIGQNLVPEVSLARQAGLCYAGLVTVADHSAERPAPEARGEVRASLGMAVEALPAFVQLAAALGDCDCAGALK